MKKLILLFPILFCMCREQSLRVETSEFDLNFPSLAQSWDEGIPLGNAVIGALVWGKDSSLRISLDRVDLWDLRPNDSITSGENNNFAWVYQMVKENNYLPVQQKFDVPYDYMPAPSKIPGAALEFDLSKMGQPQHVRLSMNNAICEVMWENSAKMQTFVHATLPVGWFRIENCDESVTPNLIPPKYQSQQTQQGYNNSVVGQELSRLGYTQGEVIRSNNMITYHQKGWNDFFYDVVIRWQRQGSTLTGVWSISSSLSANQNATENTIKALERGIATDYQTHNSFWKEYWAQSSVTIPDSVLARQYRNEMYKLGSVARENSYPISLQAVWTADNGKLPPWKGDYHHDLNTELSYWPCYTGNHLKEGLGYLNTLWNQRDTHRSYTSRYFGKEGLNVPGVCTLTGEAMGGWIQYAMSPTVSAWLAQHFYLHYKYSGDTVFLREKAYPYVKEVAVFLEQMTTPDVNGVRSLPLSSNPEIYDNSIKAWFKTITNYDLALIRFAFGAASELATDLSLTDEARHWSNLQRQLPNFDIDSNGVMTIAKDFPHNESHRHLSNTMAIHPLGLIDWSNGESDRKIISATIDNIKKLGPDYWCGYSYSWFGNLQARVMDGEGAATTLRTFAECFCLKNGFHANGDQSQTGKSTFTYRPFTLEGNFAFAAAIHEMLIQSHTGVVRLFPAIPATWSDVAFDKLRTYGAFLVSAHKENNRVSYVKIFSERGGILQLQNPFGNQKYQANTSNIKQNGDILSINTTVGEKIELTIY